MRFEFATATRILFGEGTAGEVAAATRSLGRRVLLVTGASAERTQFLRGGLAEVARVRVAGEPEIGQIRTSAEYARDERCDVVVAVGGGSVIDAGKALAALLDQSRRSSGLPGSDRARAAHSSALRRR